MNKASFWNTSPRNCSKNQTGPPVNPNSPPCLLPSARPARKPETPNRESTPEERWGTATSTSCMSPAPSEKNSAPPWPRRITRAPTPAKRPAQANHRMALTWITGRRKAAVRVKRNRARTPGILQSMNCSAARSRHRRGPEKTEEHSLGSSQAKSLKLEAGARRRRSKPFEEPGFVPAW